MHLMVGGYAHNGAFGTAAFGTLWDSPVSKLVLNLATLISHSFSVLALLSTQIFTANGCGKILLIILLIQVAGAIYVAVQLSAWSFNTKHIYI